MSNRYKGGFITDSRDPLQVPDVPTSVTATAGNASASVTGTAPTNVGGGAITGYLAATTDSTASATGSSLPITVTGLTNGTAYTFNLYALNAYGISGIGGPSGSVTPAVPPYGFIAGGYNSPSTSNISYVVITTTGDGALWGDLGGSDSVRMGSCSNATTGIIAVGNDSGNTEKQLSLASAGNASAFGNLYNNALYGSFAGCNSSTRGIFAGGYYYETGNTNVIQYLTFASAGNNSSFGQLTIARGAVAGCSSPTRGVFAGGPEGASQKNRIDYITIASTGNATTFGALLSTCAYLGAAGSSTRGVFAGGGSNNVVQYITYASTGNATSFGQLTINAGSYGFCGCSSNTRAIFTNEYGSMNYITIETTGNGTSFGYLSTGTSGNRATSFSSSNGGVQ